VSDATIAALGAVAASIIAGIATIFAAKAEKNSRPVSNGFASGVRSELSEIRRLLLDHLQDHSRR
jgi:hypothetical protein